MKISGILPIGTVVMLKNSTHRVMITGYMQRKQGGDGRIFDYVGCPFPEGSLAADKNFLFDGDQIEKLHALGHIDGEAQAFMARVEALLEQIRAVEENAGESLTSIHDDIDL